MNVKSVSPVLHVKEVRSAGRCNKSHELCRPWFDAGSLRASATNRGERLCRTVALLRQQPLSLRRLKIRATVAKIVTVFTDWNKAEYLDTVIAGEGEFLSTRRR